MDNELADALPELEIIANNSPTKRKADLDRIIKIQKEIGKRRGNFSINLFTRWYSKLRGDMHNFKHSFLHHISDPETLQNFISTAVYGFARKPVFRPIFMIELENLLHNGNFKIVHRVFKESVRFRVIERDRIPELAAEDELKERIQMDRIEKSKVLQDQLLAKEELESKVSKISSEIMTPKQQKDFEYLNNLINHTGRLIQNTRAHLGHIESHHELEEVKTLEPEDYYVLATEFALNQKLWKICAKFVIRNHTYFKERPEAVNNVIDSLLFKNPTHDELHIDAIIQLVETCKVTLSEHQARMLSEKIPKDASPTLTKKVSSILLLNSNRTSTVFLSNGYKAIYKDFKANNPAGCAETWLSIKGFYHDISLHDTKVLAVLIIVFSKNKKYREIAKELVNEIPDFMYSDPELISPILDLLGDMNRPDIANTICAQLKPPLSRPMLSTLLKLHVSFDDAEGTEKVLKQIYDVGSELYTGDYVVIVGQLLKKNEFQKALNVVKTIPLEYAEMSYIAMINNIVDQSRRGKTPIPDVHLAIIETLVNKIDGFHKQRFKFWNRLGAVYIKYLCSFRDIERLAIARQIYTNTYLEPEIKQYVRDQDVIRTKFDTTNIEATSNPFAVEKNLERIILRSDETARLTILKTLADGAFIIRDHKSLDFAIKNMLDLGFTKAEVMLDLTKKYSKVNASKGLNPRRVREDELTPEARARDIAKHDTLRIITSRPLLVEKIRKRKTLQE